MQNCFFSSVLPTPANILASYAGCVLVKKLNRMTFNELSVKEPGDFGRSMITADMLKNIGRTFSLMLK